MLTFTVKKEPVIAELEANYKQNQPRRDKKVLVDAQALEAAIEFLKNPSYTEVDVSPLGKVVRKKAERSDKGKSRPAKDATENVRAQDGKDYDVGELPASTGEFAPPYDDYPEQPFGAKVVSE